ncbi:hypothetical protein CR513_44379, partial [Mucuna pruriens]
MEYSNSKVLNVLVTKAPHLSSLIHISLTRIFTFTTPLFIRLDVDYFPSDIDEGSSYKLPALFYVPSIFYDVIPIVNPPLIKCPYMVKTSPSYLHDYHIVFYYASPS